MGRLVRRGHGHIAYFDGFALVTKGTDERVAT